MEIQNVAENEVVVTKRGQIIISAKLRGKYKIEEGTRLAVIDNEDGILLKPKKSIWDMIGAYSNVATAEEIDKLLDKLRHEDE